VGISDEYLAHAGTIYEKQAKVKVEVKKPNNQKLVILYIYLYLTCFIKEKPSMGVMREVEIVWDDLLDGFENSDPEIVYFLDRNTGEVFFVPVDYEDDAFWEEVENNDDQFLQIPGFDYELERQLLHEFIKGVTNAKLKMILERTFVGKLPYGRLDEILSFYPEEMERLSALKDEIVTTRVRHWLEEHDIYPSGVQL